MANPQCAAASREGDNGGRHDYPTAGAVRVAVAARVDRFSALAYGPVGSQERFTRCSGSGNGDAVSQAREGGAPSLMFDGRAVHGPPYTRQSERDGRGTGNRSDGASDLARCAGATALAAHGFGASFLSRMGHSRFVGCVSCRLDVRDSAGERRECFSRGAISGVLRCLARAVG